MKQIITAAAFILIFFLCGAAADAYSGAGYITLFANFLAGQPAAAALVLPAASVYYLLVLILVNAV